MSEHADQGTDTKGLAGIVSLVIEGIDLRLTKLSRLVDQETDVKGEDLNGVASLLEGETGLRHVKQFSLAAVNLSPLSPM